MRSLFFLVLLPLKLICNPFEIDFPEKEELLLEDYIEIQKKLDAKKEEFELFLKDYYAKTVHLAPEFSPYDRFYFRCTRALNGNFFTEDLSIHPKKQLNCLNKGGEICIVSAAPLRGRYQKCLEKQIEGLRQLGFNGYHLSFIGAYPTPTGEETRYIGVAYAMKVFALLEAQKMGFNKVIWLDAAWVPLQDPTPLFKDLDKVGAIYTTLKNGAGWSLVEKALPPYTAKVLKALTSTDLMKGETPYVPTCLFGFKMDHPLVMEFIEDYYRCVKVGFPFLSCFPEEYVFSAILGQEKFDKWQAYNHAEKAPLKINKKLRSIKEEDAIRHKSFFFYFEHN